jgi:ribosome biogenesis protein NSA1
VHTPTHPNSKRGREGKRGGFVFPCEHLTEWALFPAGNRVWAANGQGDIRALDLRTRTLQEALKGPAGSVSALALHPSEPYIASVGLDRYVRVHNTRTRALAAKVYLKQHIMAVGFCPSIPAGETPAPGDTLAAERQEGVEEGGRDAGVRNAEEGEESDEEEEREGGGNDVEVLMVGDDEGDAEGGRGVSAPKLARAKRPREEGQPGKAKKTKKVKAKKEKKKQRS